MFHNYSTLSSDCVKLTHMCVEAAHPNMLAVLGKAFSQLKLMAETY